MTTTNLYIKLSKELKEAFKKAENFFKKHETEIVYTSDEDTGKNLPKKDEWIKLHEECVNKEIEWKAIGSKIEKNIKIAI